MLNTWSDRGRDREIERERKKFKKTRKKIEGH